MDQRQLFSILNNAYKFIGIKVMGQIQIMKKFNIVISNIIIL